MAKKTFMEPECEIVRFDVEDILTSSAVPENETWDIGEIEAP